VATVRIIGHTDSVGSDAFNQKLSEQRAASVVSFLLSQGVAADKLSSEGRGESEPVDSNDTDAGRAKNRRVEIHLTH
jgi:outer membrane protein OmpA-like peptidoglycan-associated protein